MIQECLGTLRLRLNFEYHRVPFWGAIKRRLKTSSAPRVDIEVILSDGSPDYQKKHFELILRYFLGAVFLANM
jgi:hypothetical protein